MNRLDGPRSGTDWVAIGSEVVVMAAEVVEAAVPVVMVVVVVMVEPPWVVVVESPPPWWWRWMELRGPQWSAWRVWVAK
jgi:hypothetical protein